MHKAQLLKIAIDHDFHITREQHADIISEIDEDAIKDLTDDEDFDSEMYWNEFETVPVDYAASNFCIDIDEDAQNMLNKDKLHAVNKTCHPLKIGGDLSYVLSEDNFWEMLKTLFD